MFSPLAAISASHAGVLARSRRLNRRALEHHQRSPRLAAARDPGAEARRVLARLEHRRDRRAGDLAPGSGCTRDLPREELVAVLARQRAPDRHTDETGLLADERLSRLADRGD